MTEFFGIAIVDKATYVSVGGFQKRESKMQEDVVRLEKGNNPSGSIIRKIMHAFSHLLGNVQRQKLL